MKAKLFHFPHDARKDSDRSRVLSNRLRKVLDAKYAEDGYRNCRSTESGQSKKQSRIPS